MEYVRLNFGQFSNNIEAKNILKTYKFVFCTPSVLMRVV